MGSQKRKYIIFGGFDYAVRWEMDQDAVFRGIDYFVDNDPELIGTTYLGKPIYAPEKLLEEPRGGIFILIGSIVYHTELEFQLLDMGFERDKDFVWGIAWSGNEECPKLWRHIEWRDREKNKASLNTIENAEEVRQRYFVTAKMIDFGKYDSVVELGAANERIREFLPTGINYIPVDY